MKAEKSVFQIPVWPDKLRVLDCVLVSLSRVLITILEMENQFKRPKGEIWPF